MGVNDLYQKSGKAEYYCPGLKAIYTNRHWDEIPNLEKYLPAQPAIAEVKSLQGVVTTAGVPARFPNTVVDPQWDGQGHSTWIFIWDKGAFNIDHEKNGGIPSCKSCGKKLILVKGDDPYEIGAAL